MNSTHHRCRSKSAGTASTCPLGFGPRALALAFATAAAVTRLVAQQGDLVNEEQRPPPAYIKVPPAPFLRPEEARRTLVVPPGFKVELVAGDPLVQDPVAMAFDARGRLWVVELPAYNVEAFLTRKAFSFYLDQDKPVSAVPKGQVVVLESSRGDGRMDKRTVFLDQLALPRSIGFVGDGVLIADPPNLWLCHDRNGDNVADEKTLVTADYGSPVSVQMSANGLLWGRDNWLYSAMYKWRLRFAGGQWLREPMPEIGEYGITQDDEGRLYHDNSTEHLRGDWLSSHYGAGAGSTDLVFHYGATYRYGTNLKIATDETVWPIRPITGANRGFRKGILREDGSLVAFTAAAASVIYRGVNFPARYQGNAFVPEPAANLIKRDLVQDVEGRVTAADGFDRTDFLASTDERFRPVFLANGPDGALYVVDMYRGILDGFEYLTTYTRDQIIQRGLHQPLWGGGRIYRVVYEGGMMASLPDFSRATPATLVELLRHPNGWTRDMAQRRIVESGNREHVPPLNRLLGSESDRDRLYALWCLEGLSAVTEENLIAGFNDPSARVRKAALRVGETHLRRSEGNGLLAILAERVQREEPAVLAQVALSLIGVTTPAAREVLWSILPRGPEHPSLTDAVMLGLQGHEGETLDRLLVAARGQPTPIFGGRVLFETIARKIALARNTGSEAKLFTAIVNSATSEWARIALMQGLAETPRVRPAETQLQQLVATSPDPYVRHLAGKLLDRVEQEQARAAKLPPLQPLTDEQQALFRAGETTFLVCAACHQPDGSGRMAVGPNLREGLSRFASAVSPDIPIRIVLNGKTGSPGYPGSMVPFASIFTDEQIAGVLTYIRRSLGNRASAVSPADVARVRQEVGSRSEPWTNDELDALASHAK